MGKITLTNIAEELAAKNGLTRETADGFLRAFVDTIEKGLREDKMVKVRGLGTFKLMDMNDRGSVDVTTGERITIKGYTKVSFTPDSSMKEFVNRPFAHFEPTELNDGYPDEEVVEDSEEPAEDAVDEPAALPAEEPAELVVEEVSDASIDVTVDASEPDTADVPETSEITEIAETGEVAESPVIVEASEPMAPEEIEGNQEPVVFVEEAADELSTESVDVALDVITAAESIVEAEEQKESTYEDVPTIEESVDKTDEDVLVSPQTDVADKKGKKRWGCWGMGCLVVVLLFVAAIVAYFLPNSTIEDIALFEKNDLEVAEDIKVNPNLEQELGIEQSKDSTVQSTASGTSIEATVEGKSEVDSASENVVLATPTEEAKPSQPAPEVKPVATPAAHTFVVTEALAARNIKDVTVADTTEYIIEGTQATHVLQEGETLIQLARKYYGDKRLWPYIVKHNSITDFNKVAVGMSINIPVLKPDVNE